MKTPYGSIKVEFSHGKSKQDNKQNPLTEINCLTFTFKRVTGSQLLSESLARAFRTIASACLPPPAACFTTHPPFTPSCPT